MRGGKLPEAIEQAIVTLAEACQVYGYEESIAHAEEEITAERALRQAIQAALTDEWEAGHRVGVAATEERLLPPPEAPHISP